ncbi:MAG: diguanylate cyclase, partial [Paracoccaceae bacterium]
MTIQNADLTLDFAALDALMPMHLLITRSGHIGRVAPTVAKLRPDLRLSGQRFLEVFELRRPRSNVRNVADLRSIAGMRLRLQFRTGRRTTLRGILVTIPGSDDLLLNLSFGFSVIEAVQDYSLSNTDFAPTDLAVELLYLVEAKTAVMQESQNLNQRLQDAKRAAEHQARTDALTGLKNRRAMDQVLLELISSGASFCLMHLDLDYFKDVNDTLGHAAGDLVLQRVAKVLREQTRAQDTVARVGGDEFVLLFHGLIDQDRLSKIADRIIRELEQPI